ncbi:MAG: response regulator, partial [Colwellia sp.]|nr:response regulator [Colwellia sp.]
IRACYNQRANQDQMNRLQFALFGVALPSDLMADPQRSPFNIGRSISLQGFKLEKSFALASGLNVDHLDSNKLLAEIFSWSCGQPFLTQKICQLIADNSDNAQMLNEQDWLAKLLTEKIIDDWVRKDNPEHLRTIRDRLLLDENHATFNLDIYQQLLSNGDEWLKVNENIDYSRLLLTGLINIEHGLITIRAKLYRQIFNALWLKQAKENRRPYGEKLVLWQSIEDSRWLLVGEELNTANQWAKGKHLPELDHSFIAASQSQENKQAQAWNQKLQDEIQQRQQVEQELKQTLVLLEQAKAEAEQANLAKTDFLAQVSHEVRTPINSILGLSYLALQPNNTNKQSDYLGKIHRATTYMLGVVNDIVDISKLERKELAFNQQDFLLQDVLANIQDLLEIRLKDNNLTLLSNIDESCLPKLKGDATRLQQLLVNLVTNAIKHTKQGTICIDVIDIDKTDEQLSLTFVVSDTGSSYANEVIVGRVSEHSDSVIAIGLGLRLCCQLAQLMANEAGNNAGLMVTSRPSVGNKFSFTTSFSLQDCALQDDDQQLKDVPFNEQKITVVSNYKSNKKSNKKILVVEDDEINQQIIQELLIPFALSVDIVANGHQALNVLSEQHFDLVLMDIEMPIMDGITTIKEIRKLAIESPQSYVNLVNLPVIAMTAHALVDDQQRFINLGFNQHLTKPIDPAALTKLITHWLGLASQSFVNKAQVLAKPRIVLVDNRPENLRSMSANLKSHFSILAATSVTKAMVIAKKTPQPIAILVSDNFNQTQDKPALALYQQLEQLTLLLNIPLMAIVDKECSPTLGFGVSKLISAEQLRTLLSL